MILPPLTAPTMGTAASRRVGPETVTRTEATADWDAVRERVRGWVRKEEGAGGEVCLVCFISFSRPFHLPAILSTVSEDQNGSSEGASSRQRHIIVG